MILSSEVLKDIVSVLEGLKVIAVVYVRFGGK